MYEYLNVLNNVVNVKPQSKVDVLAALISDRYFQQKHLKKLSALHKALHVIEGMPVQSLQIESYNGNNKYVVQLAEFVKHNLSSDLIGCYVHGSLGTYDNNSYSDFDALVILKDHVFNDKKSLATVVSKLKEATKFFFQFDPLQHHGWFVLSEKMLKNYPVTFFPPELFAHAKTLTDTGNNLSISYNPLKTDFIKPYKMLCHGVRKSLGQTVRIKNMFELKSLLSEFMLLPAMYVQARDKKGVYKKFSFQMASADFVNADWQVMNDVSEIREQWLLNVDETLYAKLSRHSYAGRRFAKKHSPLISAEIKSKLTPLFFNKMLNLVNAMENKINSTSQ